MFNPSFFVGRVSNKFAQGTRQHNRNGRTFQRSVAVAMIIGTIHPSW